MEKTTRPAVGTYLFVICGKSNWIGELEKVILFSNLGFFCVFEIYIQGDNMLGERKIHNMSEARVSRWAGIDILLASIVGVGKISIDSTDIIIAWYRYYLVSVKVVKPHEIY